MYKLVETDYGPFKYTFITAYELSPEQKHPYQHGNDLLKCLFGTILLQPIINMQDMKLCQFSYAISIA